MIKWMWFCSLYVNKRKGLLGNNCDLINSFVYLLSLQRDLPCFGSFCIINVSGLEFYFTKKFSQYSLLNMMQS